MKRLHPILVCMAILLALEEGCRPMQERSPTFNVIGSYFPAWMACIISGILLTLVTRQLLIGFKINAYLFPAAVVYASMVILFTMAVWLAFFRG
jgi:YtcA family